MYSLESLLSHIVSFRRRPNPVTLLTIKIKSLWIPACAGMTAVAESNDKAVFCKCQFFLQARPWKL